MLTTRADDRDVGEYCHQVYNKVLCNIDVPIQTYNVVYRHTDMNVIYYKISDTSPNCCIFDIYHNDESIENNVEDLQDIVDIFFTD